eukprot:gnl/Ergobibamus_cyprinoides/296.p2 GENE.gnl/Ergobibamus_cyprinoides/296~~gnl/Ergobibamus_cyprinoides/296.p2  ORF type:complete len:211 (+),score=80.21 gnl/Ergobibamus_cyprinoides/296:402-1034(+)
MDRVTSSLAVRFELLNKTPDPLLVDVAASADAIIALFDAFKSAAFKPLRADVAGNRKKILSALEARPDKKTLYAAVSRDVAEGEAAADASVTNAFLWYGRGIRFCAALLRGLVSAPAAKSFADIAREAYDAQLKAYHGYVVQKLFTVGLKAVPSREAVVERLAGEGAGADAGLKAEFSAECLRFVAAANALMDRVDGFYAAKGCARKDKV